MPKVLLVDDEDQFRSSLSQRLKLRGYETVDVNNGEVLAFVSRPTFDPALFGPFQRCMERFGRIAVNCATSKLLLPMFDALMRGKISTDDAIG